MNSSLAFDSVEREYDQTPYPSYPFVQTHPSLSYTLANLFSLKPTAIEKARVLELGCASGGNIIPLASQYPKASIYGIDLSAVQIQEGQKHIDALGLGNITLKHESILNFTHSEKFDYIICHGVFSWVDKTVQNKILEICQQYLSDNGVAYISYNVLPGWNMVNTVRDLMLWHTQNFQNPNDKAKQARGVLKFLTDGLQNDNSPYSSFLKNEINLLANQSDSYLLHEHLSQHNDPMYFYKFIEMANQHQLSYLSDAYLSTMFAGNLPAQFSQQLAKVQNVVASGQYMDFIRNQRFRCTLLCKNSQKVNRALNTKDIEPFYLQLMAVPEKADLSEQDLGEGKEINFNANGMNYKVRNHISQVAMLLLYQNRHRMMHYDKLVKKVAEKVKEKNLDAIKNNLNEELNLMRAVLAGLINISSYPSDYALKVADKPIACPYARYQAQTQTYVTNRRHQTVSLDPMSMVLLRLLDGEHDMASLIQAAQTEIDENRINLIDDNQKVITDQEVIKRRIPIVCENSLKTFAEQALLLKSQ